VKHLAGAVALAATLAAASQTQTQPSGLDLAAFNRSVRPQDDLFAFVNGGWVARTPMPSDRVTYGGVNELADTVEADLRAIIEGLSGGRPPRRGSPEQQIADLYTSLMDEARLESLGDAPIRPYLQKIDDASTPREFAAVAGYLSSVAAGGPFAGSVAQDGNDPQRLVVQVTQGGTLLPDPEYYVSDAPRFRDIRSRYDAYLATIFTRTRRADPASDARNVLALEIALARIQIPQDTDRVAPLRVPLSRVSAEMPGFDWHAWAKPQGIDRASALIFAQPAFFRQFAALVPETPLATWKAWLAARVITQAAPFLDNALADARFEFFGRVLSGQEAPRIRWKRAVSLVNGYLGDAIGRLYVEKHFPPAARARIQKLANAVLEAYRAAIDKSPWMSAQARRHALEKLSRMRTKIGYPSTWRDYDGLVIKADDLIGNVQRAQQFENQYRMARVGRLADGGEWIVSPQSINAYYAPALNEIVLPAALLQPPLFELEADDAVNYGGIGAVIGHEIGHAFDERGRQFDADGAIRDWWTPDDEREFRSRAAVLVRHFNGFSPAPGLHVNGELTLGENIGDLAGLSVAYRAYKASLRGRPSPVLDGFTGEQRFFFGWGRVWRSKMREEYIRQWLGTSVYPPFQYRANGPVSHIDGYYDAFGVKPGDKLYVAPETRVVFW
jgi:putative endopeptidase